MTERNEAPDSENAESASDPEPVNQDRDSDPVEDSAAGAKQASRSGQGVAWLAVLLALGAGALAGWQWWQDRLPADERPGQERLEAEAERIDSLSDQFERLGSRLDDLDERDSELADSVSTHDQALQSIRDELRASGDEIADQERRLESFSSTIDRRFDRLEERIDDQPAGAEASAPDVERLERRLALIEAAALLRLGQARAELAGDRSGAVAAYRQASERLEGVEGVGLGRLRDVVADELAALESLQLPKWDAVAERLEALEDGVSDWPGAESGVVSAPEAEIEETESWWQGIRQSMGQLVRVSPRDEAALSPAVLETLAERLRLHLLAARVAVERRDADSLSGHLAQARALIERGYDVSDPLVREALASLESADDIPGEARWPELGAALDEIERQLDAS
jgi:uroporphyrin-III C-methyltransferase